MPNRGHGRDRVMTERYFRKVLRICAEDSPNVLLAQAEIQAGRPPSGKIIVPGVLPWGDYCKRREVWDPVRQSIGLDACFYKGAASLLFPPSWLDRAHAVHQQLSQLPRTAEGVGVDSAEGGDNTVWSAVDRLGLIDMEVARTPDTSVITSKTLLFMAHHKVPPKRVLFDRGGGGKQHADRLRSQGYPVGTVAFGEPVTPEPKVGTTSVSVRKAQREEKYVYKNRRAHLYGLLRELLEPSPDSPGFGLPPKYTELRRQLAAMPLLFDSEGRLRMLPKRKARPESTEITLTEILGCSPDEADSLVLAVYAMVYTPTTNVMSAC